MPDAVKITLPDPPGKYAKNNARIARHGDKTFIAHPKRKPLALGMVPTKGPVMVTIVSFWPRMWRKNGRFPGGPCGDADATAPQVLDALAGPEGPYLDDAQVQVAILVTAYDKEHPRVEVTVAPLSRAVLELLEHETGLKLTEVLTVGQQVPL